MRHCWISSESPFLVTMFIVTNLVRRFLISLTGPDLSRTYNPDRVFIFFEKIMIHMHTVCSEFDDNFTKAALFRFFQDYHCHLQLQGTIESNSLARYWYNKFHTTQRLVFIVLHMSDEFDPVTYSTNPHTTYQFIPFTDLPKAVRCYDMQEMNVNEWHLRHDFEWVGSILLQMFIDVGSSVFSEALRNDEVMTMTHTITITSSTPTPPQSP